MHSAVIKAITKRIRLRMGSTEAAAAVQCMVRLAAKDGQITETEARRIRQGALEAKAQMDDVLKGVGA